MSNREIKFRGKRVDNGEWVYGNYIKASNGIQEIHAILPIGETIDVIIEVLPESVGQFTGLKDKNRVDVYDLDIVEGIFEVSKPATYHGSEMFTEYKVYGNVIYSNSGFAVFNQRKGSARNAWVYKSLSNIKEMKVIGNIHENTELLES